jgi:SHS2 domain-containing protein
VAPRESLRVEFDEEDVELAFVRWLNLLLAHAGERGLALGEFALRREGSRWSGEARGEPWRAGLERGVDVKGATLTALAVRRLPGGTWEARCVVDV